MRRCLVVALLLGAGCGSQVTEDGAGSELGVPVPPPSESQFDGFWVADGTLNPDQGTVGPTRLLIEVLRDRPSCVAEATGPGCPAAHFTETGGFRPVTVNDGVVRMQFTMDFPPCLYDHLDDFDGESLIEVTIAGFEIPGTGGSVFDVAIEQRYIFTGITLLSTGTLEHFPQNMRNSCR